MVKEFNQTTQIAPIQSASASVNDGKAAERVSLTDVLSWRVCYLPKPFPIFPFALFSPKQSYGRTASAAAENNRGSYLRALYLAAVRSHI